MAIGAKNEPTKVPGKGVSKGGKVGSLQHMHMRADEMAAHDSGMKPSQAGYPSSPPHEGPNLNSAGPGPVGNENMQAGLGPIDVPGKGL
jgi:hypothetical protein